MPKVVDKLRVGPDKVILYLNVCKMLHAQFVILYTRPPVRFVF